MIGGEEHAGIQVYHFSRSSDIVSLDSAATAVSAAQGDGFIWLDFYQPVREELLDLVDPLGPHPLSIEERFDANQIPKIEDYPDHTFILF